MASARHKQTREAHRSTRLARIAAPAIAATLVTGTVVGAAVAWPDDSSRSMVASRIGGATAPPVVRDVPAKRDVGVSRAAEREPLKPERTKKPAPAPTVTKVARSEIVDHQFMTTALNVWSGPGENYTLLEVLPAGTKVPVTGDVVDGQWTEISYDGLSRWVNAAYLTEEKPQPEQPQPEEAQPEEAQAREAGISGAPCPSGSSVESGLTPDAVAAHRAVCAAFPEVTSYGGVRSDGEHSQGLGLDIMASGSLGDQIAEFVRSNSSSLGVSEVLWSQQIWTVQRGSDGWRPFEDRGSDTANHYDHVHVTVYGSSAG